MVSVSYETSNEIDQRLRRVIVDARLTIFDGYYEFIEQTHEKIFTLPSGCLAAIRDESVWSFLVPARKSTIEPFMLWRFHFRRDLDNSGFVGWLATAIKLQTGTGVFVTCGQNSEDGGIFDYWGCPPSAGPAAIRLINDLRKGL